MSKASSVKTCTILAFVMYTTFSLNVRGQIDSYTIKTVAGVSEEFLNKEGQAQRAVLNSPTAVAVDNEGNVYIAERDVQRIRKVTPDGIIHNFAGIGKSGPGNAGNLLERSFGNPVGLAVNRDGGVFIIDFAGVIKKVTSEGKVALVFGFPSRLFAQGDVKVDARGNIYIADAGHNSVWKVNESKLVPSRPGQPEVLVRPVGTLVAGTGEEGFGGDGGLATEARLNSPSGLAIDRDGNIYIADRFNHRVRKVGINGRISTVAGSGTEGTSGDGGPATAAQLGSPLRLSIDSAGNLYIFDIEYRRVRRVTPSGIISTIACATRNGYQTACSSVAAGSDSGTSLYGFNIDARDNLYIADPEFAQVFKIDAKGVLSVIAGVGSGFNGDGGPAVEAILSEPKSVAVDGAGNLFFTDSYGNRIRKITPDGLVSTIAGTGESGFGGDGGPATDALLSYPAGLAIDNEGNLFFADPERVRKITKNGVITTIAGTGERGFSGDGGPAVAAQLNYPTYVAVDASGNVYVTEKNNSRVRKITPQGIISTFAGTGEQYRSSGDGGPATSAGLHNPEGIAVDAQGNLYIAEEAYNAVRRVSSAGIITSVTGTQIEDFTGDGGPAKEAHLSRPLAVACDRKGNLYIADAGNGRIRRVTPEGRIYTIAGRTARGKCSDGAPATDCAISPEHLTVDGDGNIYFVDGNFIRKLIPTRPPSQPKPQIR